MDAAPSKAEVGDTQSDTSSSANTTPLPKLIIRNGRLVIEVSNYGKAIERITQIVWSSNGLIADQSTSYSGNDKPNGQMTLRIPAAKFDSVLLLIKSVANRVTNESVTAEDVSKAYYDNEAHLQNKRAAEQRLQELMKSAKSVGDIMAVEKELADVREEIEQLQGTQKATQYNVAYSTLELSINGESQAGFWSDLVASIERGTSGFVSTLLGVVTFAIASIPAIVFILALIWVLSKLLRAYRKRLHAKQSKQQPT